VRGGLLNTELGGYTEPACVSLCITNFDDLFRNEKARQLIELAGFYLVAGTGFEPVTFRL
jgi:hypothetical protein